MSKEFDRSVTTQLVPWVEKYRPVVFDDIIGNEEALERLKVFASKGNLPNVLLCGTPGVGKTSTILVLARKLLGSQMKDAILELNASNDRGIDVVRNRIKDFAQTKVTLPPGRHKLIILDEADSMTEGAQQALRRTMEIYSKTTRFALACNTSDKLIEAIQSRCAVVRFYKLTDEQIMTKLKEICRKEDVPYDKEGLEAVVFTAQGDMRQGINNLQSTFDGFGKVTSENVFKVCDEPHPLVIKEMMNHCVKSNYGEGFKILDHLWKLGYSSDDIITNIFRVTKNMEIAEYVKLEFLKNVGITHMRIIQGNNSLLQLSALLAKCCKVTLKK